MMNRGSDRRRASHLTEMPTRVMALRDIAERIEEDHPLEALMLRNMADGMDWQKADDEGRQLDPSAEIAGATLFDRRSGADRREEPESREEAGLGGS